VSRSRIASKSTSEIVYGRLRSWHLAKLRAAAAAFVFEYSRLTPMRRIEGDQRALELISREEEFDASGKSQRRKYISALIYFSFLLLCIAVAFWTSSLQSPVLTAISGFFLGFAALSFSQNGSKAAIKEALNNVEQLWKVPDSNGDNGSERVHPPFDQHLIDVLDQAALRETSIADYSSSLLIAFDGNGIIQCSNLAIYRLLGMTPEQVQGSSIDQLIVDPDNARLYTLLEQCKSQGSVQFQAMAFSKNQTVVDLKLEVEWSSTEKLFFAIGYDISHEKIAMRARNEVIAMIAHDIGAPLQAVSFSVNSLLDGLYGTLPPEASNSVQRAERNLQMVIDLVNELIELEREKATGLVLNYTSFDLQELVAEAMEKNAQLATQLKVLVNNQVSPTLINADRKRILRVLINLLSNAIKFSPSGSSITVECRSLAEHIQVTITDQGPGIPELYRNAIFDQYVQVPQGAVNSEAKSAGGFGLGLAICKMFITAHGGEIGVSDSHSGGSRFWFNLPRAEETPSVQM
jgi:PAS domain S-box-containing protein